MNIYNSKKLTELVADLKEDEAIDLAQEMIDRGGDPLTVLQHCKNGLFEAGKRYEQRVYFISALIMGGEIMNRISRMIRPLISNNVYENEKGLILLATVKGDIHYLGKDLFKVMAQCHGYTVKDLGVDVTPEEVAKAMKESRPDIVGLSCLLHQGFDQLKQTITACRETNPASQPLPAFIIGGLVDRDVSDYVRADFHTNDAMEGVRICHSVIKNRK